MKQSREDVAMGEQEGIRRESSQTDPRGIDEMKNRMVPEGYGAIRCMFYIFCRW